MYNAQRARMAHFASAVDDDLISCNHGNAHKQMISLMAVAISMISIQDGIGIRIFSPI